MIPGDIAAELAVAVRAAVAAGELPATAMGVPATGTWHPVPERAGGGPGSYGTSLPFRLAELAGREPGPVAARMAARIAAAPWIAAARGTGDGYLTVSVTARYLAGLPARIRAAGSAVARTDALAGTRLTAPAMPDLTVAAGWPAAWHGQHDALIGRICGAAGATVKTLDSERKATPAATTQADPGEVSVAIAYHGGDAVRYALARVASPDRSLITRSLRVRLDLTNPFVAVRYAHAEAASTRRWAAELARTSPPPAGPGFGQGAPGPAAGQRPLGRPARPDAPGPPAWSAGPLEPEPAELRLLDTLSWLPERLGAAARRRRPAELPRYLEQLAATWLDCQEASPPLEFGGAGASSDPGVTAARLTLADAVRVTLSALLGLLKVAAPDRI